jgi:hypothetical protein
MPDHRFQTQFSLEQAASAAPTLAALREQNRESQWGLEQIQHLIPAALRRQVQAGPIHETEWCMLVSSAAASTKLRQLLPILPQPLTHQGARISNIRLKVQTPQR